MAANTGPNLNTYIIPEVELGDTFNVWRDTTNTQTFKLNKLKVYDGVSSSSITLTLSEGGTFQAQIADNVGKGVTFTQPVVFSSGVTFNGDVTFNAQTFTVNANNVTIDDYSLVLGATGPTNNNDSNINIAGGGGLLLNRGTGGDTAAWLWRATRVQGLTGIWGSNAHIGLCGASAGLYPNNGGILPIHGTGVRLDGNVDGAHGLQVDLTNGTGVNSIVSLSRYSPAGSTVFAEVLNGVTYGSRPFLNVKDGVNRKTIRTEGNHNLAFGVPVRLTSTNPPSYVRARANDPDNAEVVGVVSSIISTTEFELTFIGEIFGDFSGVTDTSTSLSTGKTYYLSPSVEGKITLTQPTSSGTVHKAVLIATGPNSAVVIPFTGGVLTQSITLSSTTSVSQRINQLNKFKIGDVIRFRATTQPVTLSYTVTGRPGNVVQQTYTHGNYVLAEAGNNANLAQPNPEILNSVTAQVAGMIVGVGDAVYGSGYPGNPNDYVNASFDVLMDGWFDNPNVGLNLTPGTEYWLDANVANPSNPCFENPSKTSFTTQRPGISTFIRKKLFLATSPISGYLYSYRGDPVQASETTVVSLTNSLITDLRSDVNGDLNIGVFNGGGAGGQRSIVVSTEPTASLGVGSKRGNVGIGNPSWTLYNSASSGDRILAALDVVGTVRVGATLAAGTIPGADLLIARDVPDTQANGVTASTRLVVGTDHTDGNLVLGYKVRPSPTTRNEYLGSITGTHDRSVLVIGASGSVPVLRWRTAPSSAVSNLNTAVTMNEVFSIHGTTAAFSGSITGVTLALTAKATSAATVSTDSSTTLTTKGYVDAFPAAIVAQIPGIDQTWSVIANTNRIFGTGYQNTTTKPIMVSVTMQGTVGHLDIQGDVAPNTGSGGSAGTYVTVGRQQERSGTSNASMCVNICFIVPPNHWYRVSSPGAATGSTTWSELR